jgi:hypothetical protein
LERTSLDGWCLDVSLDRGSVLTTLVTTVSTYFILFLGLALLSRATFDSDHPDVHVYAHLPTSAFFFGRNFANWRPKNPSATSTEDFFGKFSKKLPYFLEKKEKTEKKSPDFRQ